MMIFLFRASGDRKDKGGRSSAGGMNISFFNIFFSTCTQGPISLIDFTERIYVKQIINK